MIKKIQFRDQLQWASNMHPARIVFPRSGGIEYPSVENFYQAMKYPERAVEGSKRGELSLMDDTPTIRERIASMAPREAKKYVRLNMAQQHMLNREELEQNMAEGLRQKFSPRDMAVKLVLVNPKELIEYNIWHDNYWGICTCGGDRCDGGLNRLGQLLRQVRAAIINRSGMPDFY